jgi:hypothetical protein
MPKQPHQAIRSNSAYVSCHCGLAPQSPRPGYLREHSPRNFRCYPLRGTYANFRAASAKSVITVPRRNTHTGKAPITPILPPASPFLTNATKRTRKNLTQAPSPRRRPVSVITIDKEPLFRAPPEAPREDLLLNGSHF